MEGMRLCSTLTMVSPFLSSCVLCSRLIWACSLDSALHWLCWTFLMKWALVPCPDGNGQEQVDMLLVPHLSRLSPLPEFHYTHFPHFYLYLWCSYFWVGWLWEARCYNLLDCPICHPHSNLKVHFCIPAKLLSHFFELHGIFHSPHSAPTEAQKLAPSTLSAFTLPHCCCCCLEYLFPHLFPASHASTFGASFLLPSLILLWWLPVFWCSSPSQHF